MAEVCPTPSVLIDLTRYTFFCASHHHQCSISHLLHPGSSTYQKNTTTASARPSPTLLQWHADYVKRQTPRRKYIFHSVVLVAIEAVHRFTIGSMADGQTGEATVHTHSCRSKSLLIALRYVPSLFPCHNCFKVFPCDSLTSNGSKLGVL